MVYSSVFVSVAYVVMAASSALAEPQIMTAPDAASAVNNAEMILIDIRSPSEWEETGVAEGAIALTMHRTDFPQKITALLATEQDKTVGFICATGGRTEYVVNILSQNGFSDIVDVSEGMFGNNNGPGWIARGLPLVSAQEAQTAYQLMASTH